MALDAKTGKILWDHTAYDGAVFDARHRRSSFAGPTPVTDGTMVFAYFGPEGLYAYDANGELAWKVVTQFPTLGLGTGTSPVLFENLVIIQRDEDNGEQSALVAYDKKTGKEVWSTKRTVEITWGTPVLVRAAAGPSSSRTATSSSSPTIRRPGRNCGGRLACRATPFIRRSSATGS